jgi:glutathione S-transferase
MALTLYHCAETRSMRSLWLLEELGLPFELVTMPFDHTELRTPAYRKIHPLGRVPAITDGELTLFESGAIAEYLCEVYDRRTAWAARWATPSAINSCNGFISPRP